MRKHGRTGQHLIAARAQQRIIAGNVRLALRAIHDQQIDWGRGSRQFHIGREHATAKTDDTGFAQAFDQPQTGVFAPIGPGFEKIGIVITIIAERFDFDARQRLSGSMPDQTVFDRYNATRRRCMHVSRQQAGSLADALASTHHLANDDARVRRFANVLQQRNLQTGGQWQPPQSTRTRQLARVEP
jgi:hypothetical protein